MSIPTWLIIVVALAVLAALFFLVFKKKSGISPRKRAAMNKKTAECILAGIGGKDNIASFAHCSTRIKITAKDHELIDDNMLRSSGAAGIIRPGKTVIQIVLGPDVQAVCDEINSLIG